MRFFRKAALGFALAAVLAAPAVRAWSATGRAVSLNALAGSLKSAGSSLCGITRLTGFVEDKGRRDVILIGEVDQSLPPLHADDFIVALRNVWLAYARVEGRTRYYAAPGCSIDPDPATLRELQAIGERMGRASTPSEVEGLLDEWVAVGRGPRKVRVMGVPFDSRFAKVMVDADYYMKRLVNGSVSLNIEGFDSLSDLTLKELQQSIAAGKMLSGSSMSRFWFSPKETLYEEEDGAVNLTASTVKLLTEEQFLTQQGRIAGRGRPNPLADAFAKSFTAHYTEIAAARPIYKELDALFRLVVIARLVKDSGARCAGVDYLLGSYGVATVPVSRLVLGLTNVKRMESKEQTADGYRLSSAVLPSCGGVSMDVRPRRVGPPARAARPKCQGKTGEPSKAATVPPGRIPGGIGRASAAPPRSATEASQGSARHASAPALRSGTEGPHAASAAPLRSATEASRRVTLKKAVLAARKSPGALSWDFPVPGK